MSKSVFNTAAFDHRQEPMFLGQGVNLIRADDVKYPWLVELTDRQHSYFWRPVEVDVSNERADFDRLTPAEKHMFVANIQYQSLLDSIQTMSVPRVFGLACSLPELEEWLAAWSFFESIHNRSYIHNLRGIFDNPAEILSRTMLTPEIIGRARTITAHYDKFVAIMEDPRSTMEDKRRGLILALCAANILEGLLFYVSFACSYSLAERRLMIGNSTIIELINRDEITHLAFTQRALKLIREGAEGPEWAASFQACVPAMRAMFNTAADQEHNWATYLFREGAVIGFNEQVAQQYVRYLTDRRMRSIGLDPLFGGDVANPIPWVNNYANATQKQEAQQEKEAASYLTAQVDNNVDLSALNF